MTLQEKIISKYHPYDFNAIDLIIAFLSFVIAVAFYTANLTPSVSAGDNGELTTAMYYLGIAHAPCYPLHSLIGKLATFIPVSTVAWRANFFSSLCGGITIYFAVLVYLKLLLSCRVDKKVALPVSVITGLTYMLSDTLWGQSVMCEVYTISAIFHPVSFILLLKWIDKVIANKGSQQPYFGEQYLLGYAFLFGVAMAGHQTFMLTGFFGGGVILFVLYVFTIEPRIKNLTRTQWETGILYLLVLVLMLSISYGFYYYKIMRLESNLYVKSNVMWGIVPFLVCNAFLGIIYLFDHFIAPDRIDASNPLQLGFYVIVKMFGMFYIGYCVHVYMFIRSHGHPPINWMGISEVKEWWLKFGKFFNAVWRKQYGNSGKLPVLLPNLLEQFRISIVQINGSQFAYPIYLVMLLGGISLFRKNIYLFVAICFAFITFNLSLTPFLSFNFEVRAVFFVKVFYIFSYFCLTVFVAFGFSQIFGYLLKVSGIQTVGFDTKTKKVKSETKPEVANG